MPEIDGKRSASPKKKAKGKKKRRNERDEESVEFQDEEEEEDLVEEEEEEKEKLTPEEKEFLDIRKGYYQFIENLENREKYHEIMPAISRMFEFLVRAYENEKRYIEKCNQMQEEIEFTSFKIDKTMRDLADGNEQLITLKKERNEARRMVDIVTAQELATQEAIDECSRRVLRLTEENNEKQKEIELIGLCKTDRDLLDHIHQEMRVEIETLQEQLQRSVSFQYELERRTSAADLKSNALQDELNKKHDDIDAMVQEKKKLEDSLRDAKETLEKKEGDLLSSTNELNITRQTITKLELTLKEEKVAFDEVLRDFMKCKGTLAKRQTELEDEVAYKEKLISQLNEYEENLRFQTETLRSAEIDLIKYKNIEENLLRKLDRERKMLGDAKAEREQIAAKLADTAKALTVTQKQVKEGEAYAKNLIQDKAKLESSLTAMIQMRQKQMQLAKVTEQAKIQLEYELGDCVKGFKETSRDAQNLRIQVTVLEEEKKTLEKDAQKLLDEMKRKMMDMRSCNINLAETEAKLREEQKAHENVRMEKNYFRNNLVIAENEIIDLKQKIQIYNRQLKQQREEIWIRQSEKVREGSLLEKCTEEKQTMTMQLHKTKRFLRQKKAEVKTMEEEVSSLNTVIQKAENENQKKQIIIDQIMNVRDVLGSQLVRRNDEVALLYEKIRIMESMMHAGEQQYRQRLDDIRLLKIEVKRLRHQNALHAEGTDTAQKFKKDIIELQRELTTSQQRVTLLEEELRTSLNVHRWRKLETTDPDNLTLARKVQLLQRRLLAQSSRALKREQEMRENLAMYQSLSELVAKQPDLEAKERTNKLERTLRERERQLKVLRADLSAQASQARAALEDEARVRKELQDIKKLYHGLRRRSSSRPINKLPSECRFPTIESSLASRLSADRGSSVLQSVHSVPWQ